MKKLGLIVFLVLAVCGGSWAQEESDSGVPTEPIVTTIGKECRAFNPETKKAEDVCCTALNVLLAQNATHAMLTWCFTLPVEDVCVRQCQVVDAVAKVTSPPEATSNE